MVRHCRIYPEGQKYAQKARESRICRESPWDRIQNAAVKSANTVPQLKGKIGQPSSTFTSQEMDPKNNVIDSQAMLIAHLDKTSTDGKIFLLTFMATACPEMRYGDVWDSTAD